MKATSGRHRAGLAGTSSQANSADVAIGVMRSAAVEYPSLQWKAAFIDGASAHSPAVQVQIKPLSLTASAISDVKIMMRLCLYL